MHWPPTRVRVLTEQGPPPVGTAKQSPAPVINSIGSPCTQDAQRSRMTSGSLVVPTWVHLQQRQTVTYRFLCINCVEIWFLSCSCQQEMTLVEHMQILVGNGNSPRLWLDAYHAPLIPIAPGFSWQCNLGRWRSLEPCFALCVKISYHLQYATMWLPLHYLLQYLHSSYFSRVFLLFWSTTMCSTGSSCGQQVPNVIRCYGNWLIVSRIA